MINFGSLQLFNFDRALASCRYVRAAVHKIMYTLLEVKPTQTKVMVESCIDPSGGMPLGLANIYGGIWGGKQLRHLTHQCDKIVEERSK